VNFEPLPEAELEEEASRQSTTGLAFLWNSKEAEEAEVG
jgi:hypothetical protein